MIDSVSFSKLLRDLKQTKTKLVAVSKTKPIEDIQHLYNLNQRVFGENKVQELVEKKAALPPDIEWHFIGSLQKNKVNKIVGVASLIHSVNSFELAKKINTRAEKLAIIQTVLLQVNISGEESKQGFSKQEIEACFKDVLELKSINILGLMTIGDHVEDLDIVRQSFQKLAQLRDELALKFSCELPELSMGMTNDYLLAQAEGATFVRIGSLLFGERKYIGDIA
jgi:hypothetical protein